MRCDANTFDGTPQQVARRLLGHSLVRKIHGQRLSGIIVEVEAYLSQNDPASHSAIGRKNRNASMFGPAGLLYVYTIHTRHCLNVVTEPEGTGSAVLIRAIEPIEGIQWMSEHRNRPAFDQRSSHPKSITQQSKTTSLLRELSSGPGRLCEALQVDLKQDGLDLLTSDQVWIEQPSQAVIDRQWKAVESNRIGISKGVELGLRWFIDGHQLVSGCARQHSQGRHWRFGAA